MYRLNAEPENQRNKAGAIGLVFKKYDDQIRRYAPLQIWKASQPPQAISLAVENRIANEIEGCIFTSLTRMTARLICVLAAILNLRFLSH